MQNQTVKIKSSTASTYKAHKTAKRRKPKFIQGWYELQFPEKFKQPIDNHMKSYKDGHVNHKSGLELKAFRYCDYNPSILEWSLEPFAIQYLSPIDSKMHRYYPDIWIRFKTGEVFLVEIKSSAETKLPRKNDKMYAKKMQTFLVNQAKWQAAKGFCEVNNMHFQILTEKVLN